MRCCQLQVGSYYKCCPTCGTPLWKDCPAGHLCRPWWEFCGECGLKLNNTVPTQPMTEQIDALIAAAAVAEREACAVLCAEINDIDHWGEFFAAKIRPKPYGRLGG